MGKGLAVKALYRLIVININIIEIILTSTPSPPHYFQAARCGVQGMVHIKWPGLVLTVDEETSI